MSPKNYDEINLFELFEVLWDGKWLIGKFIAVFTLLGFGFVFLTDKVYESKLTYSVDTIPPFYEDVMVLNNFRTKFYSSREFEKWKQININSSIDFEDFSLTEIVDGFLLSKDEIYQLVTIKSEETSGFMLVKSDQLHTLNDFFEYAIYISGVLKREYIIRAKEELKIIRARFKDLGAADSSIVDTVLSIDRYIVAAEKGSDILSIQRPSMPKKVSPKTSLILAMSVVLGAIVGVFFILIRNAVTIHKERSAKS